jgi:1,4-dihydroxy-2-naphthoate octaprenyltransferase
MERHHPTFFQMIRAPFLSSIISPLLAGTAIAVYVSGGIELLNFVIVFIMGICLHIATNVYNDIYDTLQGTDKINVNRNEFSGGSGILVNFPELFPRMYWIARLSLVGALLATMILWFRIDDHLKITLLILFFLSAFFSKYYTAGPVQIASRGLGEVSVWFAFGPMAILVAAVSQNVGFDAVILIASPITGLSTLSILLIGQMIDHDADKTAGKWGIAVRLGNKAAAYLFTGIQIFLCINVFILSIVYMNSGRPLLLSLIPYIVFLPKIVSLVVVQNDQMDSLKKAAQMNVMLHLLFSLLFTISIIITIFLQR